MTETVKDLEDRIREALNADFQNRLRSRGLARGLIWYDGTLPDGAPPFDDDLSSDLLYFAHSVLHLALRLRELDPDSKVLSTTFRAVGEVIESVVHRGKKQKYDRGFNCVTAATSFHLGGYAAQAYSILPRDLMNLSITELAMVHLIRRDLDKLNKMVVTWLLNEEHRDEQIALKLSQDKHFDEDEAIYTILIGSFMRSIAFFNHAIVTGDKRSARMSLQLMNDTASIATEFRFVTNWWSAILAFHLLDELWSYSLHIRLPVLPSSDVNSTRWNMLRNQYIQKLRIDKPTVIELWPSQIEAATRSIDITDNLVVALPTGTGKTRVAELCILRTLAEKRRVIYIAPLKALSAQIERNFRSIFTALGFTVSSLYGSAGILSSDAEVIDQNNITVATPEKLDFMIRGNPSMLDDVGLIILDEGHMVDSDERGVRFEVLVQQLLLRKDSRRRRIVCLSAVFPSNEVLKDFIDWIRQDVPGDSITKMWRPTRQRFGHIKWRECSARMELLMDNENVYVREFIRESTPPKGSRRRNKFPNDRKELTLASAWKFVGLGHGVLIYCPMQKSVEPLGEKVLKCIEQKVLKPHKISIDHIRDAVEVGKEWLGLDHVAVRCLSNGIAIHHGKLPRPFLNEVEKLILKGNWPIIIASPTVAQGLNLPISVLLIPSVRKGRDDMESKEFVNVAGRVGRAYVDTEGLVLHIAMDKCKQKVYRSLQRWSNLVEKSKLSKIESGLLTLIWRVFRRISENSKIQHNQVIEYILNHEDAWMLKVDDGQDTSKEVSMWYRDIASLDSAILSLISASTEASKIRETLDTALYTSLYNRQLSTIANNKRENIPRLLNCRAQRIWDSTTTIKRSGCKVAGVGLQAGDSFGTNLDLLTGFQKEAEDAIMHGDASSASNAIISFANIVFDVAPFDVAKDEKDVWKNVLKAWMDGKAAKEITDLCGKESVELLEDTLTYRLPWAIEAFRSFANEVGQDSAKQLTGLPALAVSAGSTNKSVIVLLKAGLESREVAKFVVEVTGVNLESIQDLVIWLESNDAKRFATSGNWQNAEKKELWNRFVRSMQSMRVNTWKEIEYTLEVQWFGSQPSRETTITVARHEESNSDLVLTPDLVPLGKLKELLIRPRSIIRSWIGEKENTIHVQYFGLGD